MSDTPRTEALLDRMVDRREKDFGAVYRELIDHARKLERELADAIRELEAARARLEWSPDHPYDGIACRDETIKGLERDLDEAREHRRLLLDEWVTGATLIEQEREVQRLRSYAERLARLLEEYVLADEGADPAVVELTCERCRPSGPYVIPGTVCLKHAARAALAKNPNPAGLALAAEASRPAALDGEASGAGGAGTGFHVWERRSEDDIEFVAQVNGPRGEALTEARHYAMQVGSTAIIEEVTRREVERRTTKG